MNPVRRLLGGVVSLLVLLLLVGGVPALLVLGVGNPWPGRERIELGDERAIVVGALAALAWLVWARFCAAVAVELPRQLEERRDQREHRPMDRVQLGVPPPSPPGTVTMLAARLVAAVLVLVPVMARVAPSSAAPLAAATASAAGTGVADVGPPTRLGGPAAAMPTLPARVPVTPSVVVAPGDTLIGLARRHLGDGRRWRELFELNRDRPQADGGRLTVPSTLQPDWSLLLPADAVEIQPAGAAPAPPLAAPPPPPGDGAYLPAGPVTIQPGDSLWALSEARLAAAGADDDDAAVAEHVRLVVAGNPAVVEDPDLIFPGEQFQFPALGTPPPPTVPAGPPPVAGNAAPAPTAAPPPAGSAAAVPPAVSSTAVASTVAGTTDPVVAGTAGTAGDSTTTDAPATTPPAAAGPDGDGGDDGARARPSSPSPLGLGEAVVLATGVLALLAARRRRQLRQARPRARVPEPARQSVATERALRAVEAPERVLRVDMALRAAAAELVDGDARPLLVRVSGTGDVELALSAPARLSPPWVGAASRWTLAGGVAVEALVEAARTVSAPCLAVTQLGVDRDGREVLVDLEALALLSIGGAPDQADAVLRGIAATLAASVFADVVNLVGVGVEPVAFLGHRLGQHAVSLPAALQLATTAVGTTAAADESTFALRARHTSGEAWEPAVVFASSEAAGELTPDVASRLVRGSRGVAVVIATDVPGAPWRLVPGRDTWWLEPAGLELTPVGLSADELLAVNDIISDGAALVEDDWRPPADDPQSALPPSGDEVCERHEGADGDAAIADRAPTAGEGEAGGVGSLGHLAGSDNGNGHVVPTTSDAAARYEDAPWSLLVRLLGPVDIVDRNGVAVTFERSKTLELVAWLALHRDRSTRAGARTALWATEVRDATFANVVSEARRTMVRHVAPPQGEEWLARTLTERLPLHPMVLCDADIVRARVDHARRQPPPAAVETLRPALALIRDLPFTGTAYAWPDPEGIMSNLVLLATSAAAELAGHHLSSGDVDGVFWATGQGLKVLPGHEELIALRMRAHHRAGDLSGIRLEWESYERVLDASPWSDGEPAPKLVHLRRELLA